MRGTAHWFEEYAASHRHSVNKALHFICVPLIVWSLIGLLWSLPAPGRAVHEYANWATYAVVAAIGYYAVLSIPLALGALPLLASMLWSVGLYARSATVPLWAVPLWCSCSPGSASSSVTPSKGSGHPSSRTCNFF